MDFFTNLSPWHWWALGVLCLAIEIIAPSAYLLWPAAAAILLGIALWIKPDIDWMVQYFSFFLLSIVALGVWRAGPWRRSGSSDHPLLNQRGAQYVGRAATVVASFHNGRGHVDIDDSHWGAETEDGSNPALGTQVIITSVDGTMLRVALPAKQAEPPPQ